MVVPGEPSKKGLLLRGRGKKVEPKEIRKQK